MAVEWIRVHHEGVGGETTIPAESLANYEARGWLVVHDTTPDAVTDEGTPVAPADKES